MASVLALVSKAVWESLEAVPLGGVVAVDRYTSKHAAFAQLGEGDSIFLVTVRPKGVLLVGVIDQTKRRGEAVVGLPNRTPLIFIDTQLRQLVLADGKGITAPLDKLGMSLQTPRVLAAQDAVLLRSAAPATAKVSSSRVVEMKLPDKSRSSSSAKASRAATAAPKLRGGELGSQAKALVAQIYKDPDDRALRGVLADQLLQDQHVWGELISLQLTNPKRHAERIEQIFRQHAREIVGDIANVASRDCMTIVDGFLHTATCGKSKTFTSADERHAGALAPQWATVRTVRLTSMMTGTFIKELLHNPASANLTRIEDGAWSGIKPRLVRAKAADPWQIANTRCERVLDGLPAAELARIAMPAKPALRDLLEAARARRAKAAAKPDPKKSSRKRSRKR